MINDITQLDAQRQPIDDAAEAALDRHIQWLGMMAEINRQAGRCTDAPIWLDQRSRAIAACTPAHKARLESERLARFEASQCYFDLQGEEHAKRLGEAA